MRLYRVFEDDNFVYIMMELCECQVKILKFKYNLLNNNILDNARITEAKDETE